MAIELSCFAGETGQEDSNQQGDGAAESQRHTRCIPAYKTVKQTP